MDQEKSQENTFGDALRVINIGIEVFAEDLRSEGVEVIHVDWHPATEGNERLASILASLDDA
jgi:FdrA protein